MSHQPPEPAPRAESVEHAATRHVNRSPWNWLLLLPLIATLVPWVYNRTSPTLAGIPFFYWFQMAAIAVGVVSVVLVYRKTRGER